MSHQIAYMIGGARLGTDDRGQGDKGPGIEDRDDSENGQRQGTGTCCAAAWRSQQRAPQRRCGRCNGAAGGGAAALRGAKTTKGEDSPFGENSLELCRWAAPPGQEAGLCRCRLFFVVF